MAAMTGYPNHKLLASLISLPPQPHIVYTSHSPTFPSSNDSFFIERARRQITASNHHRCLLLSFLYSVRIDKDNSAIYIYAITSRDRLQETMHLVSALQFEGLTGQCTHHVPHLLNKVFPGADPQSFTPHSIYPCSSVCSTSLIPCPSCLDQSLPPPKSPSVTSPSNPSCVPLLPRISLRRTYSHFLDAVTIRLIDDVSKNAGAKRTARRLRNGFLLGTWEHPSGGEWGMGWEGALNRFVD
jgi:mediator of RNA polymerase II transcription subunit 13